ncbi:hypothetical protein LTR97_001517 [Elasticomyces elasticus]|uniref:C2H2-type domain-containing protein n=1 Tax=Elasticomyces elasticus TaxID=574655 RepID=A0AAN7WHM7_9PEZI|nr:hypothetical protein LTR97_001517 [Elasticomyces elasticus]
MAYPSREGFAGFPSHSQRYPNYATRNLPLQQNAAPSLTIDPYSGLNSAPQQMQQQQPLLRHSDSTGSRTSEDGNRPSLPSISNLLGIANGDNRPVRESDINPAQQQTAQQSQQSQPMSFEQRSRQSYMSQDPSNGQRIARPPTPPVRNDSVLERANLLRTDSSSTSNGSSVPAQTHYAGSALNNMEADHQRVTHANFLKRHSIPSQPNTSPYGQVPYKTSPFTSSPGNVSNGSYYSPEVPYSASGVYQQRPLPSSFPPAPVPSTTVQSTPTSATSNPWEHHHYISPSSQATFPQSQDRYICQTCNKAFSRPSSLKIHSHSHTGEKPFRCPHGGCGKAFSVRSNMKRHERGCHTGGNANGSAGHLG